MEENHYYQQYGNFDPNFSYYPYYYHHQYNNIYPQNPNYLPQQTNYFPTTQQQYHPNHYNFSNTTSSNSAPINPTQPKVPTIALSAVVSRKKVTTKSKRKTALPEVEAAIKTARRELIDSNQRVLVWKVSRLALAKLHADGWDAQSWDSMGFCISEIPLLSRLLLAEAQLYYAQAKNVKDSIEVYVKIWKQACQEYTPIEVFGKILELHQIKKGKRNVLKSTFSAYPAVGFLNLTVLSIKMGIWDNFCDTFPLKGELGPSVGHSIRTFVTTWKEACQKYSEVEVLEKMLEFYGVSNKSRDKLRNILTKYPFVGFLNVAVTSIKRGMWDNLCNTIQSAGEQEQANNHADELTRSASDDVEPKEKDPGLDNESLPGSASCVDVENIVRKVLDYLADSSMLSVGSSHIDNTLMFVKQLCHCKVWLAEQFSVDEFESLGHGDLLSFLESNTSIVQQELLKSVGGKKPVEQSLEVSMVKHQFVTLLSQASNSLWEDNNVNEEKISELLKRQFPFISFKSFGNSKTGGIKELLDIIRQGRSDITSNNLLYSAALMGTSNYANSVGVNENGPSDNFGAIAGISANLGLVTSRDAVEVLLEAPFLTDLKSWSHWDATFAPSLGSFLEWLLTDTNAKALTCLLTQDGKIIRIDQLASGDLFLEALIQELPSQIAVQLLSVFALSGGRRRVPLSLLKCQARKGFEVIMANFMRSTDFNNSQNREEMSDCVSNLRWMKKALQLMSRIVIDCLVVLPSEFRCFAADVLISGCQTLFKDIASATLLQCTRMEERLMLHEVGLSLGVVAWINDHSSFCPVTEKPTVMSVEPSPLVSVNPDIKYSQCEMHTDAIPDVGVPEKEDVENAMSPLLSEQGSQEHDAYLVIDSIRREEFGIDPNNSNLESCLLKKQHARLGRALHCLSQGLYSQDAHFLLELVQNADDNVYPGNVEPTLSFILQRTSITVLNNERGFTAENMRALCDVGNSTKKGSSAGYIGEKGIGFKSVFRVTDAPEIHSNGFHVKFSISADQIGFVLPTIVPPCNIDVFDRLISEGDVQHCWNTCILLPFKPKLSEGSAASSILNMFSDLHPSLLLFLHQIKCIRLRNILDDSNIIMRKEILGDGIVKVSHGKEKTIWYITSKRLHPKINRSNVHISEISLAFMLKETENGDYEPCLNQQPVFAFLPLRTYGLKFIFQADFVLPSSREEVDVDSPWNQWLLSEFPDLFVNSEKSLCSLRCFQENPAKAVSVYMSFVPLIGEVHGFFSGLPWMIISKLRQVNCVLQDGYKDKWVPPCKVLRGWNVRTQILLPDVLLYEHLGLVLLHRDIDLSDTISRALGIEEYGPKTLVQFMTSLGRTKDGIKSMGFGWVLCWLNELHNTFLSCALNFKNSGVELDLINILRKVPFIPLSDGTYTSSDEGTIWVPDYISTGIHVDFGDEVFPRLYCKLRTVSPALFSETSDVSLIINCTRMLQKIGVQLMSGHELIRLHILPSISDDKLTEDKQLMTDYAAFVMFHLQSTCVHCHVESEHIISELRDKALILTNYGYMRSTEVPIHFSRELGNSVDVSKLINGFGYKWHEVDTIYLNHPVTNLVSCGLTKWRELFLKLGVTDFVKVVLSEKSIADISSTQMVCDRNLLSPGLVVKDWESEELAHILLLLSKDGNQRRCMYLLEVLDAVWDDHFRDKVYGRCNSIASTNNFFKSSLLASLSDIKWVVSSADNHLHYPRELFDNCCNVQSILGCYAPYAVPKIKNTELAMEIGLRNEVMLDDALAMLQTWRTMESPFTASLSHMSKFYMFIWKKVGSSRQQIVDAFRSAPCIFVPYTSVKLQEDNVAGVFLSPSELYWHDPTGSLNLIQDATTRVLPHTKKKSGSVWNTGTSLNKTLCSVYTGLHDFFVAECGVNEVPPFRHYLQILQLLSRTALPVEAANVVFQVLLRWCDGIKDGALSADDMTYLKECLSQLEFTVLPTMGNKWVSSHPSFGLVCWCDDDNLKKEFNHTDDVVFLYFGELSEIEKEMVHIKLSELLKLLGIPSLSQIVSREPIYDNPADSSNTTLMVEWVLPFAQYYLYNLHHEKYSQLKRSGFVEIQQLKVVVVEKLFYCNVIKKLDCSSKKHAECSCLLQGNVLYTTHCSDSYSVFLELSRLFFDGSPNIHLANFLHMITVMAESGLTNEQIELFILNSQNMTMLPLEESVWCLSPILSLHHKNAEFLVESFLPTNINEHIYCKSIKKLKNSSCVPLNWKTTHFAYNSGIDQSGNMNGVFYGVDHHQADGASIEIDTHVEEKETIDPETTVFPFPEIHNDHLHNPRQSGMKPLVNPGDLLPEEGQAKNTQSHSSTAGSQQAMETGRQGELVAFAYFVEKAGGKVVKWVNQEEETGLPYDIVVGEKESLEYIEVKASRYARKEWFEISTKEWQFAVEKGNSFSVVHVILSGGNLSRITVHKNPVKLCQTGKLQLALMTPRWYK